MVYIIKQSVIDLKSEFSSTYCNIMKQSKLQYKVIHNMVPGCGKILDVNPLWSTSTKLLIKQEHSTGQASQKKTVWRKCVCTLAKYTCPFTVHLQSVLVDYQIKWGSFDRKSVYEINIKCEIGLVINIYYYGCIIYIHILHIIRYHFNWKGKFLVIDNI